MYNVLPYVLPSVGAKRSAMMVTQRALRPAPCSDMMRSRSDVADETIGLS